MFKFLKSKKGFTLVELMIVVVIMAILVAVAVPIYSAVTKKAKIKTCAANQREIQSQVNAALLGDIITFGAEETTKSFTLKTDSAGEDADWTNAPTGLDGMFQKKPFCPEKGATITVQIDKITTAGAGEGGYKILTGCDADDHQNDIPAGNNTNPAE